MTTLLLIIIYLTFIALGLPDSLLGSSFPAIAQNLNISIDMAGYISMVVSCSTIISSLCSSFLVKKIGTKYTVSISVLLTSLSIIGFSFIKEGYTYLFFILAIPLGLGAGAIDSSLNNYVAINYKAIHMNWLHSFWGVGTSIGPLIIGSFLNPSDNSSGWNKGVITIGFILLAIALILFITLPLWNKVNIDNEISKRENDKNKEEIKTKVDKKVFLKNPVFYLALIGFFSYCALESTTGLWISSFFHYGNNLDTDKAAMLTSTFYIGITIGRFISGPLSIKIKPKNMIRIGEVIIVIGLILVFLNFDIVLPMIGFIVIGVGSSPIYPA